MHSFPTLDICLALLAQWISVLFRKRPLHITSF